MLAAIGQGYRWPNVCGGKAECGVCHVLVLSGDPPPPEERETTAILAYRGRAAAADPRVRLGCQLRVVADLVVRKVGVRPDAELPSAT
jgi:2Fe-2S ferredoxin